MVDYRPSHEQKIDRTNVVLILADAYYRLNQYYGQRAGLAPEAEGAWNEIALEVSRILDIDVGQAHQVLSDMASDRASNQLYDRNVIFKLAGG